MIPALLTSALLLQAPPPQMQASSEAPSARELLVVVAVPVYQPDGAITAETVGLPSTGAGLIHVFSRRTVCEPASAGAAEPKDAAFGWRIASQIVSRSETDVVVSVDWRRLWDAGRKVNSGPAGTVQLTLHPGDRIPLDHIPNAVPRADCRAVGLGLEVRLARSAQTTVPPAPASLPLGATPGGAQPVDAELWLTHKLPTGTEQVLHQKVRVEAKGGKFAFAPTSFTTRRGDMSVELSGMIDRYRTPAGGEFFVVSMTRIVSGADLPAAGLSGTTGATVPMPGADEVLSFEMLAPGGRARGAGGGGRGGAAVVGGVVGAGGGGAQARGGGGGGGQRSGAPGAVAPLAVLLDGHQFSLRLKVTPVG